MPIPLHSIDIFWRKLDFVSSMPVKDNNVDCEMLEKSSPHQSGSSKISFLRKLKEVVEPLVKKNNRGRPKIKREHLSNHVPHRHSFVNTTNFWDFNEQPARHSSYDVDVNVEQWERNSNPIDLNKEPSDQSSPQINLNEEPVGNLLMKQIPSMFHSYVTDIRDVRGDGNCGFRAIAACLGFGEDHWLYIRQQLLDELLTSYNVYADVFTDGLNEIHTSLSFSESPAPLQHWMVMPDTSILIANRFGVTVNFLSNGECSTCFPLWKGPEEFQSHPIITIAHVNGNHYVMVTLEGDHPMPPILRYWVRHKAPSAVTWETMYMRRLENYRQLNPRCSEKVFVDLSYFM